MDSDDADRADDNADLDRILGEAAHVLRVVGFAGDGLTVIGGLVPTLLVPVVDPAYGRPHVGTRDVDLCLSLALIEEGAQGYERLETSLKEAGFRPSGQSFRWRHPSGTEVEFFCPAGDDRPPGRMHRPAAGPGKQTLGNRLTALALDAGELLVADRRIERRTVSLPDDRGVIDFDFPVTGPAGFLAAKVAALDERDKPKDAYDIVWLLEAWQGGPEAVADSIISSIGVEMPEPIGLLRQRMSAAFASADHHGPRAYARFLVEEGNAEERRAHAVRAHAATGVFLDRFG